MAQYAQLRLQKKRRKEIESVLGEHWELGSDGRVFEHAIDTQESEGKGKGKGKGRGKSKGKDKDKDEVEDADAEKKYQESGKLEHTQDSGRTELVDVAEDAYQTHMRKRKRSGSSASADATGGEIDEDLRPLEDWLLTYATPAGTATSGLHTEVIRSIQRDAGGESTSAAGVKGKTHGLGKNNLQFSAGRPRAPRRKTSVKREEEEGKEGGKVEQFFSRDPTPAEPYGKASALNYDIFRQLSTERREQDDILDEQAPDASGDSAQLELPKLEECSKAYCTDFLREPLAPVEQHGERECARGRGCIFYLMCTQFPNSAEEVSQDSAFICREFLLPSQLERWESDRVLPAERQLCLGCNRMLTTYWYYRYMNAYANVDAKTETNADTGIDTDKVPFKSWIRRSSQGRTEEKTDDNDDESAQRRPETPVVVESIQDHCNTVGKAGDYNLDYCLYPNPGEQWVGISRPIVRFSADTYYYSKMKVAGQKTGRAIELKCAEEIKVDFR